MKTCSTQRTKNGKEFEMALQYSGQQPPYTCHCNLKRELCESLKPNVSLAKVNEGETSPYRMQHNFLSAKPVIIRLRKWR